MMSHSEKKAIKTIDKKFSREVCSKIQILRQKLSKFWEVSRKNTRKLEPHSVWNYKCPILRVQNPLFNNFVGELQMVYIYYLLDFNHHAIKYT